MVKSDFLIKTPAIRILHDNINAIVLNERFNKLDESGPLKNSEELDFIFSTLFILLIKIREINSFQSIFFAIELISDEIHLSRGTLTKRTNVFVLLQALLDLTGRNLSLFHVPHQSLAFLDSNGFDEEIDGSHSYTLVTECFLLRQLAAISLVSLAVMTTTGIVRSRSSSCMRESNSNPSISGM